MSGQTQHFYAFGPYRLDSQKRILVRDGTPVPLAPKAAETLLLLVKNAGHLVEKDELMAQIWPDAFVEEGNLNRNVFVLRQLLGERDGGREYIETVPKRGYRFVAPVEEVTHAEGPAQPKPMFGRDLLGKKVSHYRVLEVIGGGGMGLVYEAEDLKLGRRVALKFLPEELANDAVALHRFEREAQTASSLNHPNICTIHEVEEHQGQPFMVMELLKGETLRDRLAASDSKVLSVDQLLDIAIQMCDGLQAAHERGIIHRDIKPANIFLTTSGQVKILDFGLAKLMATSEEPEKPHASTGSGPPMMLADATFTRTGVVLGTAGYMSPEQIRKEKLDPRSDLFSFGLVLYEMAAGRRAFTGDTAAVVHNAILHQTPTSPHEINFGVPPRLEVIISRALEKDRERRYQSAAQMRATLRELRHAPSRWQRRAILGMAVVLLFAVGFLGFRSKFQKRDPARELVVRQLTPNSADNPVYDQVLLSPDGRHLAYSDGVSGLTLLQVDTGDSRVYPDTNSLVPLSWLRDGDHLFAAKLGSAGTWKISTLDGSKQKFLEETVDPLPSPDGRQILFCTHDEIWLMDADGETRRKILSLESPWSLGLLVWSPTGRRIAHEKVRAVRTDISLAWGNPYEVTLETCDLQGACSKSFSDSRLNLASGITNFVWLPDGRIVFALREQPPNDQNSNLWSLDVDPNTGHVRGEAKRLTNWSGFEQQNLTSSEDGKRLVFQQMRTESTIKIAELGSNESRLATPRSFNAETWYGRPAGWTHDSQGAVFIGSRYGKNGIFLQKVHDGTLRALVSGSAIYDPAVLSPDGRWLLYTERVEGVSPRLLRLSLDGGSASVVLTGDYGYNCASSFSAFCAMSEFAGNDVVFSVLDLFNGRGRSLARIPVKRGPSGISYSWSLSPDGSKIALVDQTNSLRILDLQHEGVTSLHMKEWDQLQFVNWSGDGLRLFVSGGRNFSSGFAIWGILETDLAGRFSVLAEIPNNRGWVAYPLPSPDGRYLIYVDWRFASSVTMLENF